MIETEEQINLLVTAFRETVTSMVYKYTREASQLGTIGGLWNTLNFADVEAAARVAAHRAFTGDAERLSGA